MRKRVWLFALVGASANFARAASPDWLTYCPDERPPLSQSRLFYGHLSYDASNKRITIDVPRRLKSVQYTCSALESCDGRLEWQPKNVAAPEGPGFYLLTTSGNEIGPWCAYFWAF